MSLLLHTDTCASVIRETRSMRDRFAQTTSGLHVSVVSIYGLEVWLLRSRTPLQYRQKFFNLQYSVVLLNVTEPVAHRAAMLSSRLRQQGQRMGLADAFIAATALEHGLTLVTHSVQRFANITGLTVIDWAVP
jgi:tRNA(fMet)-specific endonuclease VapC